MLRRRQMTVKKLKKAHMMKGRLQFHNTMKPHIMMRLVITRIILQMRSQQLKVNQQVYWMRLLTLIQQTRFEKLFHTYAFPKVVQSVT
jgi:hypothetical protein